MPDTNLPVVTNQPAAMTQLSRLLSDAMTNPDFSIELMERVTNLGLKLMEKQQEIAFWESLAAVQSEQQPVFRGRKNVHLGNTYASLDDIMDMLQPILNRHGMAIVFGEEAGAPEGYTRHTITVAKGGFSRTTTKDMASDVTGARGGATQMTKQQMVKAVQTYARRTMITGFFNLTSADEDDDGEHGRDTQGSARAETQQRQAQADMVKPVDHEANLKQFEEILATYKTEGGIQKMLAVPDLNKWLTNAPSEIKIRANVLLAARRKFIAEATAKAKADREAAEAQPATDTQGEAAATGPSSTLAELLDRISKCADMADLDACMTAPEFSLAVAKLSFSEGDQVTVAMKARMAELGAATPAGA